MTAKLDIRMDPAQVDAAVKGTKNNVSQLAGEFAKLGPEAAKFAAEIAKSYAQLQRDNAKLRTEVAKANDGTREQQREQARLKTIAQEAIDAQLGPADRIRKKQEDLTAAHKAGLLTLEQYNAATKRVSDSLDDMSDSGTDALKSIGSQFLSLVGLSATVAGIADKVREALEDAKRLQQEQATSQMNAAVAQAEVVKMLGDPTAAGTFLSRSETARTESGFQDVDAWNTAAANVLSATAGDQELTLSILKTIAPLQKNKPAELSALTGAVADIATLQGAVSEKDVQQVFSMVIEAIGQSRITNYQAFKEAAAATAAALQTDSAAQAEITGADGSRAIREAQAATAAIGGTIQDSTGQAGQTAIGELTRQLETLLPERDVVTPVSDEKRGRLQGQLASLSQAVAEFETRRAAEPDAVSAEDQATVDAQRAEIAKLQQQLAGVQRQGTGLRTLAERIEAVQASPELQAQLFQQAQFEAPALPAMRNLLTDSQSAEAQRWKQAQDDLLAAQGDDNTQRARAIREAQAAFAAVGGAIKDPMGSQTKTAIAALATQLEAFLPTQDVVVSLSDEERANTEARIAKLTEEVAAFDAQKAAAAEGISPEDQATADAKREQLAHLRAQKPRYATDQARINAQARELENELADFDAQVKAREMPTEAQASAAEAKRQQIAGLQKKLTGVETEGSGLQTLAERIRAVQESPELQAKFFEKAAFERPVMPVIRSLLTNRQSEAAQRFEAASGKIGVDATVYERTLEALRTATPQLNLQERAKTSEALASAFDIANTGAGIKTKAEEIMESGLRRSRRGWTIADWWNENAPLGGTSSFMGTFDRAAKEGPIQAVNEAQKQLLIRRAEIAGIPQPRIRYRTDEQVVTEMRRVEAKTDFSGADRQRIKTLPEDQQKMVELLTGLLKELQGLREEAQRTNANTSRTADALTIAPGSGASVQAAQPSPQRLGR